MRKKFWTVFLSLVMCLTLLPFHVFAVDPSSYVQVDGLRWEPGTFKASWNAYSGAYTGELSYFLSVYKDTVRINSGLSATPGFIGNETSYDLTSLVEANGAGVYTFDVGVAFNSSEDLNYTTSALSPTRTYSVPVYEVNVTTDDYKMGRVAAKIYGNEVQTASEGASVTLFAEASRGYRFVEWQSSDVNVASGSFKMPAQNVNVKAVFKEFPAVSGLTWDAGSFKGSWNAYPGATKYEVVLYKNGSTVRDQSTRMALPGEISPATSYDFTDLIEANGDGDYKFTVAAYIDNEQDLNDSISEMSEAKKYDGVPNVKGVAWDTDSFKGTWDAYTGVDQYFVSLYKDGKRINNEYDAAQPGYVGNVTSYDFSTLISKNGEGTYTFEVGAYINSAEDLVATMSERSTGKKYSLATYKVTVEVEGGNYFCMASSNPLSADQGENITLSATPGTGYHFVEWKSSDVDVTSGSFKMPAKDVTVTAVFAKDNPDKYTVSFNMNGHGTDIDSQSVEEGHTAVEPSKPTESGWIFEGWYTDAKFTSEFDFSTVITEYTTLFAKWKPEVVYTPDNSDTQIWEKGSTKSLDYVFHRSEEDSKTFSLFEGILIDGESVSADNYDAASGSLILKIKASFLETLAEGMHKLTVQFADGSVSVEFQIKLAPTPTPEPTPTPNPNPTPTPNPGPTPTPNPDPTPSPSPDSPLPKTGDDRNSTVWFAMMLISMSALAGTLIYDKKRKHI